MDIRIDSALLSLARRRELELVDGVGTRIVCEVGSVWITQEHDTRDIVLGAGEAFVLDRPGLALVRAMGPSVIALCGRPSRRECVFSRQGGAFFALSAH